MYDRSAVVLVELNKFVQLYTKHVQRVSSLVSTGTILYIRELTSAEQWTVGRESVTQ